MTGNCHGGPTNSFNFPRALNRGATPFDKKTRKTVRGWPKIEVGRNKSALLPVLLANDQSCGIAARQPNWGHVVC
jgi:hypothetical protein